MIILDTNVISELMRIRPEPAVVNWLARNGTDSLYTTAITRAEILAGIAVLPEGKRRRELESSAARAFAEGFITKILPFDQEAAPHFAAVIAARRGNEKIADAMIAAIARLHGAAVATRDVKDFTDCGIVVRDPWTEDI